jgi:hypothetical protein
MAHQIQGVARNAVSECRCVIGNPRDRASIGLDHDGVIALEAHNGTSSDRITAIDTNRRAGDEIRCPRRQVHSGSGNFLRLPPPTGGSPRKNLVVQGHCMHGCRHVRFNPPWRDCIDLNVVRGKLNGHGLGQLDNSSFRCAVGGDEPRSKERIHTANVDNLSTFTIEHRSGSELRKEENCVELRFDDAVPIFRSFIQHTAAQRHVARVIYQDTYATELALDRIKRGLQRGAVG